MLNNMNGPSNISPPLKEIIENDYILRNISPLNLTNPMLSEQSK